MEECASTGKSYSFPPSPPQPHKKSYGRLQYCACVSLVEQYPFDGLIHILQRFASFIRDVSHNHSLPMLQKVEQLNCSYYNQHLRSDLSPLNSFVLYTLLPPSFHSLLLPMNALYDHLSLNSIWKSNYRPLYVTVSQTRISLPIYITIKLIHRQHPRVANTGCLVPVGRQRPKHAKVGVL